LKTSGFSFLTNSRISLISVVLFLALILQCRPEIYFGSTREALLEKLKRPDYSFFMAVDKNSQPGEEIFSLAPGAGFFLGLAAKEYGRSDLFAHFLLLEWEKGTQPYKQWALKELLEYYNDNELYEKVAPLAEDFLEKFPASPIKDKIVVQKIRALYWLKSDVDVLEALSQFFPGTPALVGEKDPELSLFKAVASARLEKQGWETLIRDFFFKVRFSPFHKRLYSFLTSEKDKLARFTPLEQELFEAKSLLASGLYGSAVKKYESLLPLLPLESLLSSTCIADFFAASLGSSPNYSHAALIIELASRLSGAEQLSFYETAGRIYFALKDYADARAYFELVLARTGDPLIKKRLIWRLCRIGLSLGIEQAKAAFLTYVPRWDDPVYYSDLTDEFLSLLVKNRDFNSLLAFESLLKPFFTNTQKAELSYICGRALMLGYADPGPVNKEEKIKSFFRAAVTDEQWGYYAFLSAFFLKEEGLYKKTPGTKAGELKDIGDEERLVSGFIFFGLYGRALENIVINKDNLKDEALSFFASECAAREHPFEAIQILGILRERGINRFADRDFRNFYPRAFAVLVSKFASDYALDENLFFALVRQESAFHAEISSRAGAVGLSQLMPETGEWIARQLKLGTSDLKDPATSLMFGAYYLSFLTKRLETIPLLLAGYNAGPTYARTWKQSYGDLSLDLLVEALDFAETRSFIKSIFIGHVLYSLLYSNKTLGESVNLFYRL
jgi:hypothetical protein